MAEPAEATEGEVVPAPQPSVHERATALLLEHRGDARAAILDLLTRNAEMAQELDGTRMVVSVGFTRGWHHNRIGQEQS